MEIYGYVQSKHFVPFYPMTTYCNNSDNRFVDKLIFISVLDELKKLY